MRGVGVAAACSLEADVPCDFEREVVLLIGVAAVGDFDVVHKLEQGMLGCCRRSRGTVAVEVLEEEVDVVGRAVEEIAERVRRNHHATCGVNCLSQACCRVHAVGIATQSEYEDVSHVGVDFERTDDGQAGIAECVNHFSFFPAAGVFGEAYTVESDALRFLYKLLRA